MMANEQRRGRLVRRLTVTFAAMTCAAAALLAGLGYAFEYQSSMRAFDDRLTAIASLAAANVDGDAFATIKTQADEGSAAFKQIAEWLRTVGEREGLAYSYSVILKDGHPVLVVDGSEEPEAVGTPYEPDGTLDKVYAGKQVAVGGIVDEETYGRLKTAYAPILNSKGEVVGAVGSDLSAEVIVQLLLRDALEIGAAWLVVAVISVLLSRRVAVRIASRIVPLSTGAQALAAGNLGHRFDGDGKEATSPDEVDDLRASLALMQTNLTVLVRDLHDNARQVVTTSDTLAGALSHVGDLAKQTDEAMAQVASGTHNQADSATEVATFFAQFLEGLNGLTAAATVQAELVTQAAEEAGEIARVTGQMVEVARSAAAAAVDTHGAAREGSRAVEETAGAVTHIAGAVTEASEGMARLSREAEHIGAITTTIQELAEQSNLLALNAAIEAARAGDAGRGFAVVADEVRKLAVRSGQSAEQIGQILSTIRADIDATREQMDQGLASLQAGKEKANRAKSALEMIEESAATTQERISRVADDSAQSAERARQIGEKAREAARQVQASTRHAQEVAGGSGRAQQAVENVASISEETAALAAGGQELMGHVSQTLDEVSRSVEKLSSVARRLEAAAGRFQAER